MDAFIIMLKNVVVFAALAVPGLILVKTKTLKMEHSVGFSKVLLYVALPFLVFDGTLKIEFEKQTLTAILLSAAFAVVFTLAFLLVSKPYSAMEKDEKTRGMLRFCSVFSNNGFLGLPLAAAVFFDRPLVSACLVVMNIINNAMMYTVGLVLVSGDKKAMNLKNALMNPILIAFVVGLVFNLIGVNGAVPEVGKFAGYLGGLVTPLSMMILGMRLGEAKLKPMLTSWRTYYVSAIKLLLMPVIAVALAFALQLVVPVQDEFILAVFVAFATPVAAGATSYADAYGGDMQGAVTYTITSTLFCIATVPLLYWALAALL